jgi:membrane-bound metal-dependent hydrolase YbcI (DUF457 family)
MPPTGFHGLLGLLIAGKMNQDETKVGVAFGSVFPDLDLLGSILVFIFTQNKTLTIFFHRSVTHSYVIMSLILIGGILIATLRTTNSFRVRSFTFGLVLGMVIHATLDLFYLDGVALFWPFQAMEDRVILLNYTFDELSPLYNDLLAKVISTLDGGFEAIYYFIFIYLASKSNTDKNLNFSVKSKNFEITNWTTKLKQFAFGLIGITIIFLAIAIISIDIPALDRDMFIVLLYIPLAPVYLLTGLLPLIMHNTVEEFSY